MLRVLPSMVLHYRIYPGVKFRQNLPLFLHLRASSIFKSGTRHCFRTMSGQCGPTGCGFSKEQLKERLTLTQYQVTQEKDTERAFSGKYYRHEEKGTYSCIVCSQAIFSSEAKFPTPCGWPAFFDVIDSSKVKLKPDLSHDMQRLEVSCAQCNAHMGHLFDDGPKPTGKRYCINSASLDFQKSDATNTA